MFQLKARRTVPALALALAVALSFAPLASVSAAEAGQVPAGAAGLLAELEAQIVLIWEALLGTRGDAGPRMDDNG